MPLGRYVGYSDNVARYQLRCPINHKRNISDAYIGSGGTQVSTVSQPHYHCVLPGHAVWPGFRLDRRPNRPATDAPLPPRGVALSRSPTMVLSPSPVTRESATYRTSWGRLTPGSVERTAGPVATAAGRWTRRWTRPSDGDSVRSRRGEAVPRARHRMRRPRFGASTRRRTRWGRSFGDPRGTCCCTQRLGAA